MKVFQRLIKNNRFWEILISNSNKNSLTVKTRYGINDGKITETKPQTFELSKGQTFVKKKITNKIRNGYKSTGDKIKNITVNQIKNFIKPMSSIILEGNESKIEFPAYVQPKLDGFRGIAIKNQNTIKNQIVSRNGLPYPHLKQIKKDLQTFPLLKQGYQLDGEIYLHGEKLGKIRSVLGRKVLNSPEVLEIEKKIEYVIFDFYPSDLPFEKRFIELKKAFASWNIKNNSVKLIETSLVKNLSDVNNLREKYITGGYEGIIVRNKKGLYVSGKKSPNVLRSKDFKNESFKIVGALEGKGNDKGTVIWKLQCLKDSKRTFTAKPMGTKQERSKLYQNRDKYIGTKIQIKYFELDNKTGCVSRHPVALSHIKIF